MKLCRMWQSRTDDGDQIHGRMWNFLTRKPFEASEEPSTQLRAAQVLLHSHPEADFMLKPLRTRSAPKQCPRGRAWDSHRTVNSECAALDRAKGSKWVRQGSVRVHGTGL